jgi:hypothetical protein
MNMNEIPASKKAELLKALQAVVGKIEEIEEEAKATQDTPAEHSLPPELEAAIKELHELAEKHDKTFVLAMEVFDDSEKTGKALSCNGIVGKQIELVCDIIEQIAEACDERPSKIVSDITRRMLMSEMLDKGETACD